jgi:molybdopterin-guanine dinucleotide biosynthesis protein MobB
MSDRTNILGICGYSGSGKTTLIEALVPRLRRMGLKVAVVKHDVHGIDVDRPGKDSDRLFRAGADVFLDGAEQGLVRVHREMSGDAFELLSSLGRHYDVVLVEGRKHSPIQKLWLLSPEEDAPPPNATDVLAVLSWDGDRVDQAWRVLTERL